MKTLFGLIVALAMMTSPAFARDARAHHASHRPRVAGRRHRVHRGHQGRPRVRKPRHHKEEVPAPDET